MIDPADRPSEDLELFLASARGIPAMDPAAKSALLSKILTRIDVPGDPSGEGGSGTPAPLPMSPSPPITVPPAPPIPIARMLGGATVQQIAGWFLLFSVGGATGALMDRTLRDPEIKTVYVEVAVSTNAPSKYASGVPAPAIPAVGSAASSMANSAHDGASSASLGSSSTTPPVTMGEPSAVAHAASATPAASDSASAPLKDNKDGKESRDSDLSAERSLLERARSALGRGNVGGAMEALNRHVTDFPRGRLSEEREAIWIQALAASGRTGEARQRLARYKASYPRSFSLPALEAALGEP